MELLTLTFGLSVSDVADISSATLVLFAVSFGFRETYRFIIGTNYGRY